MVFKHIFICCSDPRCLDCVRITSVVLALPVASPFWLAVGSRSLLGGLFTNFCMSF